MHTVTVQLASFGSGRKRSDGIVLAGSAARLAGAGELAGAKICARSTWAAGAGWAAWRLGNRRNIRRVQARTIGSFFIFISSRRSIPRSDENRPSPSVSLASLPLLACPPGPGRRKSLLPGFLPVRPQRTAERHTKSNEDQDSQRKESRHEDQEKH